MIDRLGPYPTCKPSSIKWLGDVPEHWEVRRGKMLVQPVDVRSNTGSEELLTVSAERGVIPRKSANVSMFKAESYVGYKLCWPGDLVINSLWAWAHGLGVSQYHGIVSSAYGVYRPLPKFKCHSPFIHYLVRSIPFQWELQVRSKGIWISRLQLTDETFLGASFPLPPPSEQTAIVRYLDHADRRIQRYISGKQKLIKLLEEQKQAIIHRAVTRGLDPDVCLKPSGVEWLGDVPEHWEVVGLKFLSRRIQNGATPSTVETRYYETGSIPWYGPSSCRYKEKVDSPVRYLTADAFKEGKARLIHGPALLVIVIGATAGRLALLTEDGSTNQQITSFELNTVLVHPLFILRQARSAEHWLRATASTATIPILDTGVVSRLSVAFPPLPEQTVIVEHLDKTTANIDTAINRARRQIELLSEYHTRLIADVVTGKLDVRDADISASGEVPTLNGIDDLEEKTEPDEVDVMEEIYGDD